MPSLAPRVAHVVKMPRVVRMVITVKYVCVSRKEREREKVSKKKSKKEKERREKEINQETKGKKQLTCFISPKVYGNEDLILYHGGQRRGNEFGGLMR